MSNIPPELDKNTRFIKELPDGSFRDCTDAEIELALLTRKLAAQLCNSIDVLQKELTALLEVCTHPVQYDLPGMPYDVRHCVTCMHTSLV